jgi:MFS family permease
MSAKLPANINKMYAFNFLINMHFISGVMVPFFTRWGGITFAQTMLLQSWFSIWLFILEIPTGAVADRWGRKISIALGSLVAALGVMIYSSTPNFIIFMIGEFLLAVASAFISGADQALVYDSLKEAGQENSSKKVLNRYLSAMRLAIMFSAPMGSMIASAFGLRYAMLLMSIPMGIAGIVALFIREPRLSADAPRETKRYWDALKQGIRFLLRHRVARVMVADAVPVAALSFMLIWLYQPLLMQLNLDITYFGWVQAAMTGAQIIILLYYPELERLLGSKQRYLAWSALGGGFGMVLLAYMNRIYIVIPLAVVLSAFGMTRMDIFSNYLQKYIDSDIRATVLSTVMMLRRIVIACIQPVIGFLADWSLRTTFVIIGVSMIMLMLLSKVREEHLIG